MSRRQPVLREERVCPTVETAAKLKRDPLELAAQAFRATDGRDGLSPEREEAVILIRRAYHIITAPVASRVADYLRTDRSHGEMSDNAAWLVAHYNDWANAVYARGLSVYRALDVLLDDAEREWHGRDLEKVNALAQIWIDIRR
jgi:hypothetical protein